MASSNKRTYEAALAEATDPTTTTQWQDEQRDVPQVISKEIPIVKAWLDSWEDDFPIANCPVHWHALRTNWVSFLSATSSHPSSALAPNRKRLKWGKGPETDVSAHRRFKEDRRARISAQGALWRVSDNAEALLERWPRKARLLMNRVVDSDNDTPLASLMSDFGKQRRFNSVWSSMICFLLYCTEEKGALKRMGLELSEEQEDDLLDIAVVMSFEGYPRPGDDGDGSSVDHAMHAYIMTLLTDRDATPSTNPLLWWAIVLIRSSIEDGPEDFISRGHFARNILPMDLDIAQRLEGIEHFAKVFLLDLAFNTWDPADKGQLLSVQEDLNAADNSWLGERSSIRPAERETDKLKCTSPAWKSMLLHLEHTFAKHTKTSQGAALHPILTLRQELRALRHEQSTLYII